MKRILSSIFIMICTLFVVNNNVYAMENEQINEATYELISNFSEKDIIIENINQHSENEYIVELKYEGVNYGYIMYKYENNNYLPVDFIIEKGVSYYEDDKYSTVYSNAGEIITSDILSGLKYSSYNCLTYSSCISSSYIESVTNRYACAVVALTEVANQNHIMKNNSIADTFNAIWDYTETEEEYVQYGITYGSTYGSKLASGMKAYVKSQGYSIKTTTEDTPSYSFFKTAINKGYSCTLSYSIYVEGLLNTKKSNHVVNVIGWYIYKDSNGKQYKYLAVADGWHSTRRYMLYEEIDFISTKGITYNIY